LKPATRVWLVVLSWTPGSTMTPPPAGPSASPMLWPLHRPLSTPEYFWKATKLFPTAQGSRLSGLFHQMTT
jgi:hypothetical protein